MARTTHETRFLLTAKDQTRRAFGSVRTGIGQVKGAVTGLHTGLIALAGLGGIGFLTKGLLDVNAEFQTLKSSLKTVTGGTQQAKEAFDLIEKFATTTPFDLQQVTEAFIKLKAFGLDPSEAALESYGNTASAMGKSLNQMVEAVADAVTGEFERLKEFGIRAEKIAKTDLVKLTFQGQTQTIKTTNEAIQEYLQNIGKVQFGGAMADQMNNLTPAFSNFSAAIDGLFSKVGESGFNDVMAALTNDMTDFITSLDASEIMRFTQGALASLASGLENIQFVIDSIAKTYQIVDTFLGGQEAARNGTDSALTGGIPGGSSAYQLGSFNDSQRSFDEWARDIRSGSSPAARDPRVDETNGLLQEISDRIREQSSIAVAG